MEAADYDAALGQKVVDRLTPLLHRRVSSVLPYIVEREGITDMAELEAIARDAALLKGKYGLGVKSRRELIKAICDTDRADFAKPAGEVR
jgi:hypothetical protein